MRYICECGDQYCSGCEEDYQEAEAIMKEWGTLLDSPEALELTPVSLWQEMEDERAKEVADAAWGHKVRENRRIAA